jgi:tripartite-type tricarboxylate transporter receptor subunit TctC
MVAPAKTPTHIITQLNGELHAALARTDVRERLLSQGLEAQPSTPAEFSVYLQREIGKWAKVVKDANARVE